MSGNEIHMLKDTDRKKDTHKLTLSRTSVYWAHCVVDSNMLRMDEWILCSVGQMEWRTLFCPFIRVVGHSDKHIWICIRSVWWAAEVIYSDPPHTQIWPQKKGKWIASWSAGKLVIYWDFLSPDRRPNRNGWWCSFWPHDWQKILAKNIIHWRRVRWLAGWLLLQNNCHIITQAGRVSYGETFVVAEAKRQWVSCRDNKQPLL